MQPSPRSLWSNSTLGTFVPPETCEGAGYVLRPQRSGILMPGARSPAAPGFLWRDEGPVERLSVTDLTYLSDDSVRRAYEQIRDELMADARLGTTFMGAAAKHRAEVLLTEIRRRGLNVPPISSPD